MQRLSQVIEDTLVYWEWFQGLAELAGAGEVAVVVKHWSHKQEDCGTDPV